MKSMHVQVRWPQSLISSLRARMSHDLHRTLCKLYKCMSSSAHELTFLGFTHVGIELECMHLIHVFKRDCPTALAWMLRLSEVEGCDNLVPLNQLTRPWP